MADPTVSFNGDATSLLKAYADLDAARKREAAGVMDLKSKHNDASKAEREASREAEAIKSRALTAQDKYNAAVGRAKDLLDRNKIGQKEYNAELERQTQLLRESETSIASVGREAASTFLGVGSALGVALTAVAAIKAEYEELRTREKERAQGAISFGDSMRSALVNFAPDATVGRESLESRVKDIATSTGATPEAVAQVASAAFSSKANLSNETALDAVMQAFRVEPGNVGAAETLASRSLHLMASTGQTDPRAAMGLLTQAQGKATIKDLKALGQNLLPSAVSMMADGDSAEQAAELYVTLNSLMKDAEGSVSKTAAISLASQLAKSVPGANSQERIAALRANPKSLAAFLDKASFGSQEAAPIRQLLSGDPFSVAVEADVRAGIGGLDTGAAAFESFVAGINASPSQSLPAASRQSLATIRAHRLRAEADQRAGVGSAAFDETLNELEFSGLYENIGVPGWLDPTGSNAMHRWMARRDVDIGVSMGKSRPESQADVLRGLRSQISGPSADRETIDLLRSQEMLLRDIARSGQATAAGARGAPENALGRQPAGR